MKSAMKTALLLCLLLLTICWVFFAKNASAGPVIVVPDDYTTIQAAIDIALDGGSILVKPGTYPERLKISKSINVTGSGASSTFIESPGGGHTVEISFAANVVFTGFTLRGKGASLGSGIYVRSSLNDTIRDNVVINHEYGIQIYDSSGNILRNNNMSNNKYNLRVWGLFLSHFLHDIDSSNLVNGKPVYYWVNQHGKTVPSDAGYVALVNSSNVVVKDLSLSNSLAGVLLAYTNNSTVIGVAAFDNERGFYLISSNLNNIVNNTVFNSSVVGISTVSSSGNLILGNTINRTIGLGSGIRLSHSFNLLRRYSENNFIAGNIIEKGVDGIYLEASDSNNVSGNKVTNNTRYGLVVDGSSNNLIMKNTLVNNTIGIWINALERAASDNVFYHNVISNNTNTVIINPNFSSTNKWHADYPVGGNFWGLTGTDEFSGPNQDQPGSDGIIDAPYTIDEKNIDQYPLLAPPSENKPPTAQFSYFPQNPKKGEPVTFVNEAFDQDGVLILELWRFDDSLYAGNNVSTSFDEAKMYHVTLVVFDNEGTIGTATKEVIVQKHLSALSLSVPSQATVGTSINLFATLWNPEKDTPLADLPINFYLDDGTTKTYIGFSTTNTTGVAALSYTPTKTGNFKINAEFEGDHTYTSTSAVQDLIVIESRSFWLEAFIAFFVLATLALGILRWRVLRNRRKQ